MKKKKEERELTLKKSRERWKWWEEIWQNEDFKGEKEVKLCNLIVNGSDFGRGGFTEWNARWRERIQECNKEIREIRGLMSIFLIGNLGTWKGCLTYAMDHGCKNLIVST